MTNVSLEVGMQGHGSSVSFCLLQNEQSEEMSAFSLLKGLQRHVAEGIFLNSKWERLSLLCLKDSYNHLKVLFSYSSSHVLS